MIEKLYDAIIKVVVMDDIDKANLFSTLNDLPQKQIDDLIDVYINKNY